MRSGLFKRDLTPIIPVPAGAVKSLDELLRDQINAATIDDPINLSDIVEIICVAMIPVSDAVISSCDALVGRPFMSRLLAATRGEAQ